MNTIPARGEQTTVRDETGNALGFYYYDRLSRGYIAVRADGTRAFAPTMDTAARFIKGEVGSR